MASSVASQDLEGTFKKGDSDFFSMADGDRTAGNGFILAETALD